MTSSAATLHRAQAQAEPVSQFDTQEVFTFPWIIKRKQ